MPHPDMSASWVNGHPDEGLLHEWLDEQLPAPEAEAVETHVSSCAACGALVAEARGLIAASHRILSALDDVPANVIPAANANTVADDDVHNLAAARQVQDAKRQASIDTRTRNATRWRQLGKVAALLVIVLLPAYALLNSNGELAIPFAGDDVTVPRQSAAADSNAAVAEAATAVPELATAPMAPTATVTPPVAGGAGAALAASAKTAEPVAQGASDKSAASVASPPRKVATAETERTSVAAVASAPAEADRVVAARQSFAQPPVAVNITAADSGARLATLPPPPTLPATMLSGKVAGVSINRDSLSNRAGAADASAAVGVRVAATPTAPIPQLSRTRSSALPANSPAPSAEARAVTPSRAMFDSVNLSRTICATSCETTVLHVSNLGAVRFVVSSGSTSKPAVTSQLSSAGVEQLRELLSATFVEPATLRGQVRCTVSRATGVPLLELLVVSAAANGAGADTRCTTSQAELLRLGAGIDAIAGVDSLRRRVP